MVDIDAAGVLDSRGIHLYLYSGSRKKEIRKNGVKIYQNRDALIPVFLRIGESLLDCANRLHPIQSGKKKEWHNYNKNVIIKS